jgi:transposase
MAKRTPNDRVSGFINGLNRSLRPFMGPAQLGDPNEPLAPPPPRGGLCPLCGTPMDEHVLDRSGPRTFMSCPTPKAAG